MTPQLAGDGGAPGLGPGARRPGVGPAGAGPRGAALRPARAAADYERMERGYYEHLLDAGRRARRAGRRRGDGRGRPRAGAPRGPPFEAGPLAIAVDDVREYVLKPNLSIDHDGAPLDRPTPTGCATASTRRPSRRARSGSPWWATRSAPAGGSTTARGSSRRLERRLDERSRAAGGPGGRGPELRRAGPRARPALGAFRARSAGRSTPTWWSSRRPRPTPAGTSAGSAASCPAGSAGTRRSTATRWPPAGAGPGGDAGDVQGARSGRIREAILAGVYRTVVADCRSRGVPCVWVLIPRVGKPADPAERRAAGRRWPRRRASRRSSTCPTPTTGSTRPTLAIGPDDFHPNADGPRPARPPARRGPATGCPRCDGSGRPRPRTERGSRSPMSHDPTGLRPARLCFAQTLARAGRGARPLPVGWAAARSVLDSARSPELNRADREAERRRLLRGPHRRRRPRRRPRRAGAAAPGQADRLGPVPRRERHAQLLDGDFLQFELKPNVDADPLRPAVHDQPPRACATATYTVEKPDGTSTGSPCSARRSTWAGGSAPTRRTSTCSKTGSTPTPPGAGWPGGSRC